MGGRRQHACGAGPGPASFPVLTLGLAALAIAVHLAPGAREALAFDRPALAAGQLWRVVSCHWVHWSTQHLLWDVGSFLVLGAACERRSRARLASCITGSALVIGALVAWGLTDLARYGGLSGVDCALFALLGAELWVEQRRAGRAAASALALGLGLALALKLGFEWTTGTAVFVSHLGSAVSPVPAAHVAGAAVGVGVPALSFLALRPRGGQLP